MHQDRSQERFCRQCLGRLSCAALLLGPESGAEHVCWQARQDQAGPEDPVVSNRALLDNFDDPEGYYNFQVSCLHQSCLLRLSRSATFEGLARLQIGASEHGDAHC